MANRDKDTNTAEPIDDQEAENTIPDVGQIFAAWESPEHDAHHHGIWWYVIAGLFILAILDFAYFENNPLFAIIIVLVIVTFMVSERRGPDKQVAVIAEDGIIIGAAFYAYADIRNFFIIYEPPTVKMLYFNPRSALRPLVGIPLMDQNPVAIRQFLLEYIPEDLEREHEPVRDYFGRLFKF